MGYVASLGRVRLLAEITLSSFNFDRTSNQ